MANTNTSGNYPIQHGGQIIFGSTGTPHCSQDFSYVKLTSKSYWQFNLDRFWIGNGGNVKTQQAISDTGTSFLGGPSIQVAMVVDATHAIMDFENGIYTVDCDVKGLPDIEFTIGGQKYNIPPKEYILDVALGNNKCALTVIDMDLGGFGPQWVLGATFIRTYCTVYDIGQGRIGFSKIIDKNVYENSM